MERENKCRKKNTSVQTPDYKRIYRDILNEKFPQKKVVCEILLDKNNLSPLDIIELNRKIFGGTNKETEHFNQKLRSYNKETILRILDYQKTHQLNNVQLANYFKLSRNTVAKWKKLFG